MRRKCAQFIRICSMMIFILSISYSFSLADSTDISIDKEHFPDDNFRQYIIERFDTNQDFLLSEDEIQKATYISTSEPVADYTGITYFTSLSKFHSSYDPLTEVPVLPVSVKEISLYNLGLTGTLDVSRYENLTDLDCSWNQFSGTLDLSQNPKLTYVACKVNNFEQVILHPTAEYTYLNVQTNFLQSKKSVTGQKINWNGDGFNITNQKLVTVNEENFPDPKFRKYIQSQSSFYHDVAYITQWNMEDRMDSLLIKNKGIQDLTGIELLDNVKTINCSKNKLTVIPELPKTLISFSCDDNQLTALPELPDGLTSLSCSNNQLSALPELPEALESLYCDGNQIQKLPTLPASLTLLDCKKNQLTVLPALPDNLKTLHCGTNQLKSLPKMPTKIVTITCGNNQIQNILDLRHCTKISELTCTNNEITGILFEKGAPHTLKVSGNLLESKSYILGFEPKWNGESNYFGTQKKDTCTYKQSKITSATCETSGKAKLTCTDCGMIRYKPILPLGHKKVVFQKQIKASFSKHGKLKGVHCSRCKKIFEHSFDIPKVPAPSLAYEQIVYNGKVKKPTVTIDSFQGHRYTEGQQYTVKYATGRKKVGRYAVTVTLKGDYLAGSKTLYFTIVPKKPASASAKLGTGSGGYDDVHFSWSKSTGATGYLVYYKKASAKKYTFYKATTKTSVIKKNLADKTKYTFKVIPYYKTKTGKTKYYSTVQYKTRTITTKTN